jgi:hypothetical protein
MKITATGSWFGALAKGLHLGSGFIEFFSDFKDPKRVAEVYGTAESAAPVQSFPLDKTDNNQDSYEPVGAPGAWKETADKVPQDCRFVPEPLPAQAWQAVALAMLQIVGLLVCLALHIIGKWAYDLPSREFWIVFSLFAVLLTASLVVLLLCLPMRLLLRQAAESLISNSLEEQSRGSNKPIPKAFACWPLERVIHILAIADFAAAAIVICVTGGSERSVFVPFLSMMVPMIALTRVVNHRHLIAYTIASLGIFSLGLSPSFREELKILKPQWHALMLFASTTVAMLCPAIFLIAGRIRERNPVK